MTEHLTPSRFPYCFLVNPWRFWIVTSYYSSSFSVIWEVSYRILWALEKDWLFLTPFLLLFLKLAYKAWYPQFGEASLRTSSFDSGYPNNFLVEYLGSFQLLEFLSLYSFNLAKFTSTYLGGYLRKGKCLLPTPDPPTLHRTSLQNAGELFHHGVLFFICFPWEMSIWLQCSPLR